MDYGADNESKNINYNVTLDALDFFPASQPVVSAQISAFTDYESMSNALGSGLRPFFCTSRHRIGHHVFSSTVQREFNVD